MYLSNWPRFDFPTADETPLDWMQKHHTPSHVIANELIEEVDKLVYKYEIMYVCVGFDFSIEITGVKLR